MRREVDLYLPVKTFLERQGFEVKGEVGGCDVVAVRGDEPPVIVELKLQFTLGLVLQAVDRLRVSETVYVAVPAAAVRRRGIGPLCRRLGLGLLLVNGPGRAVDVAVEPGPYRPPHDRRRAARLLSEHARRAGDPTPGGTTRVPIMTAYRQEALRVAAVLAGGPASVAELRERAAAPKAGRILARDPYGWFERIERGRYRLRDGGRARLPTRAGTEEGPSGDGRRTIALPRTAGPRARGRLPASDPPSARRQQRSPPATHRRPTQMATVAASIPELLALLEGTARIEGERVVVSDEAAFRSRTIEDLAWTHTFSQDAATVDAARWIIWEASQALGARSASIQDLYAARARGEVSGFTVPAINIRMDTFDTVRKVFQVAKEKAVGPVILELARSEQTYTWQRVFEYAANVLAGAIAAGWVGPVFIQGDHYQFNAKKHAADPEAMTEEIRRACRDAVAAGYLNIDIDSSTLVDLSQPTVDLEQKVNYTVAAEIAALIRDLEPEGVTISIGGEIGEVGKTNSTIEDLRAYLDGFRRELDARRPGSVGVSKVSVQTGTSHGGVPLPGGGVAEVKLDFNVLRDLGEMGRREYGIAGTVQHGASTLPDDLFHLFPTVETAEIHLATGFQNAVYDHPAFPAELRAEIEDWCRANAADERKEGQTESQFLYTTRKKAIGPFKWQIWNLATKGDILATQALKLAFLFDQLKVTGTADLLARYVPNGPEWHRPAPDALRAALQAPGA
jgi:hypothetical protein